MGLDGLLLATGTSQLPKKKKKLSDSHLTISLSPKNDMPKYPTGRQTTRLAAASSSQYDRRVWAGEIGVDMAGVCMRLWIES